MNISYRIKQLRQMNNIKSNELASLIGVTPVFLSYLEKGTKKPSIDTLEKICTALNITLSDFFNDGSNAVTLTTELKELLESARGLSSEQIELLKNVANGLRKN